MRYKIKTLIYVVILALFLTDSYAQENKDILGSWSSGETNYVLLIKKENNKWVFINYRFEPIYKNGWKTYKRIITPGKETFVSEKNLEIINNYSIKDQNYYVTLTYNLLTDKVMQANFKGKLDNKPYNKTIIYRKENNE